MKKLKKGQTFKVSVFVFVVLLLTAIGITVGLVLAHVYRKSNDGETGFRSRLGNFSRAAVVTDARECARVGKDILEKNGTAVDSAIATLICMGVVIPHSCGIGGGFLMTIYERKSGIVHTLDARETAPSGAHKDMYEDRPSNKSVGGLSVAIPGELHGYEIARNKFRSTLSWADLFKPAIQIAKEGFAVGTHLSGAIAQYEDKLDNFPKLKHLLTNPSTGTWYKKGETMKNPDLAKTLENIARNGSSKDFYKGRIARDIVDTIQKDGGIITLEDLSSYQARWLGKEIKVQIQENPDLVLYSVPPPGSGAILSLILNVVSAYPNISEVYHKDPALFFHRLLESYKFAFAQRTFLEDRDDLNMTKLLNKMTSEDFAEEIRRKLNDSQTSQDPEYYGANVHYADDHGTAHVSVVAPNGDAVSASTTVNLYFGSRLVTEGSGILLNDEMDDFNSPNMTNAFGVPPSDANLITPGRRPQSSMAPAVLVDEKGDVKMAVGGSGGTHITTGIASVILRTMWLDQDTRTAITAPRIHHQLYPMTTIYEAEFPKNILEGLEKKGHVVEPLTGRGAVIQGIVRGKDGRLYANSDYRKEGEVDGF